MVIRKKLEGRIRCEMKTSLSFSIIVLIFLGFACQPPTETADSSVVEMEGTVEKHDNGEWIIRSTQAPTLAYAVTGLPELPEDNLPDELRHDGMRALFSGNEIEAPEGVRLWGVPFQITHIRPLPR